MLANLWAPRFLPLFEGPCVKIRLVPSGEEYKVSKALICARSPVFSAMFEGNFLESEKQEVELEEMENVVSVRSVEALIQWLYQDTICFGINSKKEKVSATIELARLGDRYDIDDLESTTAKYIADVIRSYGRRHRREINQHTGCLERDHIASAVALPRGHLVREILAQASVRGFLMSDKHKFTEETQLFPSYGADVLQEVRETLNAEVCVSGSYFDPIDGDIILQGNGR